MRPILAYLDGPEPLPLEAIRDAMAVEFNLTPEEREVMLSNQRTRAFNSKVSWAVAYMFQAKLLERPSRGRYRIAERGIAALNSGVPINNKFLQQFPEFQAFVTGGKNAGEGNEATEPVTVSQHESTPHELMDVGYNQIRAALATNLIERIMECSPAFFERLVVDLLVAMGYGGSFQDAAQVVGGTGDGGIDGIIKEDKLGLDVVYIQAKRWQGPVSRPTVQAFSGSLLSHNAHKGVMITASTFTAEARDFVRKIPTRVVLIDGKELAQLMIDHGIGVAIERTYHVKRVDSDYFETE